MAAQRHETVPEQLRELGCQVEVVDDITLVVGGFLGMDPVDAFKAGCIAQGIYDGLARDPEDLSDGFVKLVYD